MSYGQSMTGELEHEMANTRRVLERVPYEKADWKPHVKSGTLKWLAGHCAIMPGWGANVLTSDELNVHGVGSAIPDFATKEDMIAHFEAELAKYRGALMEASDDYILKPWTLRDNEQVIFTMSRIAVLRGMVMNHMIHHRAELIVYLRLLDVPVPGLYGASADEK
ncbi:DinB [Candidatus Koribacter versatilis Ellin345]|uniref:DinB n=1 Tax=Koribacter versatilis (strain Ellin345) TaxID=204669 RepID=Q1IVL4_KORVE|nr:DinB family protein [Candidatus Koribacter versatilis]ABF39086.1 DinB [Candidatus Koribacter versatilis Ellin345]